MADNVVAPTEQKQPKVDLVPDGPQDFSEGTWTATYPSGSWMEPSLINTIENPDLKVSIQFIKTAIDIIVVVHTHPKSGVRVFTFGIPDWLDRKQSVIVTLSWTERGFALLINERNIPISPFALKTILISPTEARVEVLVRENIQL